MSATVSKLIGDVRLGSRRHDASGAPDGGSPARCPRSTRFAALRVYALTHGVYLIAVLSLLAAYGHSPARILQGWDGGFYKNIASTGYPHALTFYPDGRPTRMSIAFFPLYPLLMRALSDVTRIPVGASGVVISTLAAFAAAAGIAVLVEPRFGRRGALLSVAVWAVGVDALIESMVYVQSLLAALAVWTVIALRRSRWGAAIVLVILVGLCHSTAAVVVLAVEATAVLALARAWRAPRPRPARSLARPAAAVVAAPLGIVGYWAYLAIRYSRLDAWFLAESAPGWDSSVDFGKYSAQTLASQLDGRDFGHGGTTVAHVIASVWLVPAVFLAAFLVRDLLRGRRMPWQLSVTAVAAVLMVMTDSGPWASKPRFLIPAVALAALPAVGLSRRSTRIQLGALVLIGAVSVVSSAYLVGFSPVAP